MKILNKLPKVKENKYYNEMAGKIKDDRKIIIKLRINLFSIVFVISLMQYLEINALFWPSP